MKYKYLVLLLLLTLSFASCRKCKQCHYVRTENGVVIYQTEKEEYCNEDLKAVEAEEPTVWNNQVTEWVCE